MFWFRRKYNLPPNHPLLLKLTLEDIETDFWAHHYADSPSSSSDTDDEWDMDSIIDELGSMESGEWEDVINDHKNKP